MANSELQIELGEWLEIQRKREEEFHIKYPPNPPHDCCYHALLRGVTLENSFEPRVKDYNFFFETKYEKVYIWTHKENTNSALVSEVKKEIKDQPFWKNIGNILLLAISYREAFEHFSDEDTIDYRWMYYFDPKTTTIENADFYNISQIERTYITNGRILKATYLSQMASIINLLLDDDRCYTALSLLLSSFSIHYCCLICELSINPWQDHLSHEPEIWEHAYLIPKMEAAIVQACRCVESILGEPPAQKKQSRLIEHKARWRELLGINPDDIFEKAQITYLSFYYSLFDELRNPSAHSYGNIHFDLERKKTIEAQCFAAIVLQGYIKTNKHTDEEALEYLKFNRQLLNKVSEDMSTILTSKRKKRKPKV